jgi:hypothetical protein
MQLRVLEYYERLAAGVQAILDDENVKEFLRVSRMFKGYTFANTVMIYCQKPTASKVAGLGTWNRLGRKIKKGEKGMRARHSS